MNRIYRLVWSCTQHAWVPVSEISGGLARGGNKSTRSKLLVASLTLCSAIAQANPSGGEVTAGSGSIAQTGNTTTIQQSSQNLSLNWNSFNIAANQIVNFVQPSASAIAVNRIFDTSATQILGQLNANGQVYLINPNGIVFGQGSQVNVGGLVASTLDVSDASLNSATKTFIGTGTGSVINKGNLVAANGGYIALLANQVSNQGIISAQLGTVALAGGSDITLTFADNSLVQVQVNQSTLNNLAENKQLVVADGGQVFMSAGAKNSLLASVVNNTGIIEAQTVSSHNGVINLMAGMEAGTVTVGGIIDASAPNGGNGGAIETSAATVKVADNTVVTTKAASGNSGSWLIDPVDFTIAATGGNITGAALTNALTLGTVTIQTASGGTSCTGTTCIPGTTGTAGDINVNDVVTWGGINNNLLTLNAYNNININANMNASGSASLALKFGQGAVASGNTSNIITASNAAMNLPAGTSNFTTLQGSDGTVKAYTVITSLGVAGSITTTDLQGIKGDLTLNYALGGNINASATSTWNAGAGFAPIIGATTYYNRLTSSYITKADYDLLGMMDRFRVTVSTPGFSGTFEGLGHSISALTIHQPTLDYVGLFGVTSATAAIRNVGSVGGSVNGTSSVGGLVGYNTGSISNSYATGSVTGGNYVGGLVGYSPGSISISNSYATGNVNGTSSVGGLVGYGNNSISNSYATGNVNGTSTVGGLVGTNNRSISNSYATGSVSGTGNYIGGLIGISQDTSSISNSYATGSVSGDSRVGGLAGYINSGTITNSYATGSVSGDSRVGGLAGFLNGGGTNSISNSYATGSVTGTQYIGGLVGESYGAVSYSHWNIDKIANAIGTSYVTLTYSTGLTTAEMQDASKFTGFNFTTTPGATGNNWVIVNADGTLNGTSGGGTTPMLASEYSTTINNAHQLQLMAMDLGASYILGSNINAAATGNTSDVWANSTFIPIGNSVNNFTGSFNGLGHTISDLTINLPFRNEVGLFAVAMSSTIKNIGLVGSSITGYKAVGGLVGISNASIISNSYATGSVNGTTYYVGGLVGYNSLGTINNSYAKGSVSGRYTIGGLVGYNTGSFSNSYATGSVTGVDYLDGLVGYNTGSFSNSFWNSQINTNGAGFVSNSNLSSVGMMAMSSFTGWDIANTGASGAVWRIYEGQTSPLLTNFLTPLTLTGSPDSSVTYNSSIQSSGTTSLTVDGTLLKGAAATGTNTGIYNGYYSTQQGYDLIGGNLTITPAPLTIAVTLDGHKTYDGSVTFYTGQLSISDIAGSDVVSLTAGKALTSSANAGTWAFTLFSDLALTGAQASNYTLAGVSGFGTIAKANAIVTGNSATLTYTGLEQTLNGFSATGLVNNQIASVLRGVSASGSGTNAGNYNVVASGTDSNYNLSFNNGLLTINPADNITYGVTATIDSVITQLVSSITTTSSMCLQPAIINVINFETVNNIPLPMNNITFVSNPVPMNNITVIPTNAVPNAGIRAGAVFNPVLVPMNNITVVSNPVLVPMNNNEGVLDPVPMNDNKMVLVNLNKGELDFMYSILAKYNIDITANLFYAPKNIAADFWTFLHAIVDKYAK